MLSTKLLYHVQGSITNDEVGKIKDNVSYNLSKRQPRYGNGIDLIFAEPCRSFRFSSNELSTASKEDWERVRSQGCPLWRVIGGNLRVWVGSTNLVWVDQRSLSVRPWSVFLGLC